jgi:hypothetical protein
MQWLWETIWWLICGALDFFGAKYDTVKEEIDSKPRTVA